jgi:flagellar protein FliS
MFATTPHRSPAARAPAIGLPRGPGAGYYASVGAVSGIEDASPHKLVGLLLGAVQSEIAAARGAIARGDVAEKCRAIAHALRIVDEGLLAPLDLARGGALAANLRDLYQYVVDRLTAGNVRTDDDALAEAGRLIATIAEGWNGIALQVDGDVRAA